MTTNLETALPAAYFESFKNQYFKIGFKGVKCICQNPSRDLFIIREAGSAFFSLMQSSVVQRCASLKISDVSTFISKGSFLFEKPLCRFLGYMEVKQNSKFLILLLPVLESLRSPTGIDPNRFLSANALTSCPGSDTFLCQQQISENASNEQWHFFLFVEGSVSLKIVAKCFDAKSKDFRPTAAKWAILRCA